MSHGLTLSIQTVKGRSTLEFASFQLFHVRGSAIDTNIWLTNQEAIQDVIAQMHKLVKRKKENKLKKKFLAQPRRNYFEHVQKKLGDMAHSGIHAFFICFMQFPSIFQPIIRTKYLFCRSKD